MKNSKIIFWSITVALGGFLFGFDTAVISGAEQSIERLWDLSVLEHGLTVSIALIGTVVGAMLGGWPSDAWGRKKTLFWIAALYLFSALGSALAPEWYSFMVFRFIGGLGVGASSVAAPMYISEITPAEKRGKMVGLFQFNIVLGILIAYFSNYLLADIGSSAWRWMLGVEVIPAITFLVLVMFVPKSPRWLVVKRGRVEEARQVLQIINPATAETSLKAIIASGEDEMQKQSVDSLFTRKYRFPVMLAITFAAFNQLSGINAIIYYAPRVFEMSGLEKSSALLSSIGIGVMNLIFNVIGLLLIDKIGRRKLMIMGSIGVIVTLFLVAWSFYGDSISGQLVPYLLFAYIGAFSMSQGTVIWVFISEIFPNKVRAAGQALGSFTHWILAALVSFSFPFITAQLGAGNTFLFFGIMMVLQLLFVLRVMPETKGTSLEDLGLVREEQSAKIPVEKSMAE